MTTSMLNKTVTNFELPATGGTTFKLSDYLGKTLVIYFYPKDNTPGCTTQGMQFRDSYVDFQTERERPILREHSDCSFRRLPYLQLPTKGFDLLQKFCSFSSYQRRIFFSFFAFVIFQKSHKDSFLRPKRKTCVLKMSEIWVFSQRPIIF